MDRSSTQGLGLDHSSRTSVPAFEYHMRPVAVPSGHFLAGPASEGIGLAGPEAVVVAACTAETAPAQDRVQVAARDSTHSPSSSPLSEFARSRARRALFEGAVVALTWPKT